MKPRPSLSTFSMILGLWMVLGNCYFNPAVQLVVNPDITEETSPVTLLGVASVLAAPKTVQITGQIVDANGVAAVGATITIISRTNQLDGLTNTMLLNEGGRFYLILSTGETKIRVDQSGSELFTFTISIPFPGSSMITNKSLSGPDVLNVEFYEKGITPAYLDMISSSPSQNETRMSTPTTFTFIFTETLDNLVSDQAAWIASNIITNPPISFYSTIAFNTNQFSISYFDGISSGNYYSIYLGSGIKSQSGKSLSPRLISFYCSVCPPP
ncbi:carboxypeptidase regulatory-like domain-containing protein [Leptospira mtsangambouensis]|uniref:Carboxypeptidase regulatory-like domain-containing protein n=1 Tax=Leptospira mtsangambouensis TaxID=2484912 RepID=A0ABY2NZA4_9LEPT|nr:carboxypeptidase-like regulatory domain-containing protein [Leptospira mtsangambouensis]TGM74787.1 carboxypeptidase regulatory-like domain-containing protein [Leptospira mtsangambouensis]